jgi:hypothetical protein
MKKLGQKCTVHSSGAKRRIKYETGSPHGRFQARYVINLLKIARLLYVMFNERLLLLSLKHPPRVKQQNIRHYRTTVALQTDWQLHTEAYR